MPSTTAPTMGLTILNVPTLLEDYTDCEAVDYQRHPHAPGTCPLESIDLRIPGRSDAYVRLIAVDLIEAIAGARGLLDDIEAAIHEGRDETRDAARVPCPNCRTPIDPEEDCCGHSVCAAWVHAERRVEAFT